MDSKLWRLGNVTTSVNTGNLEHQTNAAKRKATEVTPRSDAGVVLVKCTGRWLSVKCFAFYCTLFHTVMASH